MGKQNSKDWQGEDQSIPYTPQKSGYRVWLFGDSILDNAYWNDVDENMTSEQLKKLLTFDGDGENLNSKKVAVHDRAGEETDAQTMLECLENNYPYQVR